MQRYDIINHLIQKFDYKSYLEIGTQHGQCFEQIKLPRNQKRCIDIQKTFNDLDIEISSDDYFALYKDKYDIIFIDGDHSYEQSYKDLNNALQVLTPEGTIVMHDCYPTTEELAQPHWMGTVYKTIVRSKQERSDIDIEVVNTDCGCAVIRFDYGTGTLDIPSHNPQDLVYSNFIQNASKLLNLISVEDFKNKYKI